MTEERVCSACSSRKPSEEFGKRGGRCLDCVRASKREYYAANRSRALGYQKKYYTENVDRIKPYRIAYREANKDRARARDLRVKYGMTMDDFLSMSDSQGGACKICSRSAKKLYVDHDHVTGKVRGLLCSTCNTAIGLLNDDPALLEAAVAYLRSSEGS